MTLKRKRRPLLLSSTRKSMHKPQVSLSSRTARTTVRTHHTLRKQLSSAVQSGDDAIAEDIQTQLEALGGINTYQQASIQGQSTRRGGDTSRVLVGWLTTRKQRVTDDKVRKRLKLLEVGALRIDNACSRSGLFDVERIDLHSQHPDIKEQDFMERPIPKQVDLDKGGFDIVSLSLVVNFVGDSAERGEMLRRVEAFLRPSESDTTGNFPALFLVLPAACVTNSRYLDEDRLESIMESLGYRRTERKMSAKLVYYLWTFANGKEDELQSMTKQEVRTGKSRNNFAIVLH